MLISRPAGLHGNTAANPGLSRVAHVQQSNQWCHVYLTTVRRTGDFWARFSTSIQSPVSFHETVLKTATALLHLNQWVCRRTKKKLAGRAFSAERKAWCRQPNHKAPTSKLETEQNPVAWLRFSWFTPGQKNNSVVSVCSLGNQSTWMGINEYICDISICYML